MSARGEINGWTCDRCGETTYCVHVDDGVTPMFLGCRATGSVGGCEGTGRSLMYPPPPAPDHVVAAVRWEWYSPSPEEKTRLYFEDRARFEHVDKGGLLVRELTDAGRSALGFKTAGSDSTEGAERA